jgi:hypothetical protein
MVPMWHLAKIAFSEGLPISLYAMRCAADRLSVASQNIQLFKSLLRTPSLNSVCPDLEESKLLGDDIAELFLVSYLECLSVIAQTETISLAGLGYRKYSTRQSCLSMPSIHCHRLSSLELPNV